MVNLSAMRSGRSWRLPWRRRTRTGQIEGYHGPASSGWAQWVVCRIHSWLSLWQRKFESGGNHGNITHGTETAELKSARIHSQSQCTRKLPKECLDLAAHFRPLPRPDVSDPTPAVAKPQATDLFPEGHPLRCLSHALSMEGFRTEEDLRILGALSKSMQMRIL